MRRALEPSSSSSSNDRDAKALRQELSAGGGTKASIAKTLATLQKKGFLNDPELGGRLEHRKLAEAAVIHAQSKSPCGKVVQPIPLGMDDGSTYAWGIIHPLAFIWYLSSVCDRFGELMALALTMTVGRCLTLLLYGDDFTPGNPLRHDQGRKLFTFYYSFLELPSWMLHRKDAWFCFGSLRTSIIDRVVGGVSAIFAAVLKVMFLASPTNFSDVCFFLVKGVEKMYTACFKGIIADEKGLKEAFDIKGQAGVKPCISCQNIFNFIHKRGGDIGYKKGIDNVDKGSWILHNDESILALSDQLSLMTPTERGKAQTDMGINYNQKGLIGNPELRGIIKPVTQYIRDPQHTYFSNGVANIQLGCVGNADLKRRGIGLVTITEYVAHYSLPKTRGQFNPLWFSEAHLSKGFLRHFAQDIVSIIPLLLSFMLDVVKPLGIMLREIECLCLLDKLTSILMHTYDVTKEVYDNLEKTIEEHRALFRELYKEHIIVEFHHSGHLADDLWRLRRCITCFPLERKHRDLKGVSLYAFRNVELSSTRDYVNHAVQSMIEGRFRFQENWLDDAEETVINGQNFQVSWHAHTPVGEIHRDDVLLALQDNEVVVGYVNRFFAQDNAFYAECACFQIDQPGDFSDWVTDQPEAAFVDLCSVLSNLKWARLDDRRIRVIIPSTINVK